MIGIGDKIIAFTNLYFNEYSKQAKEKKLVFDDNHTAFVFYLLDKIVENFAAVGELMKLSERKNGAYLRNSVYILLRSNLSDVIIASWLFDNTDPELKDDDTIKEKADELKRDHIRFHLSHLQKMQSLGLLPAEEKEFELKIINSYYKHLLSGEEINSDLNWRKIKDSTSIKNMLNEKNKGNPVLVEAYKCYFLLSKIEHTGEFTRMILEKTYGSENPMDQFVQSSIHVIECTIKAFTPIFFTRKEFLGEIKSFTVIE